MWCCWWCDLLWWGTWLCRVKEGANPPQPAAGDWCGDGNRACVGRHWGQRKPSMALIRSLTRDQRLIRGGGVSRYQECVSDFGEEWHPVDVEGNVYHGSLQFLLADDLSSSRYCRKVSRIIKYVSCLNSVYFSNLKNLVAADVEVKANKLSFSLVVSFLYHYEVNAVYTLQAGCFWGLKDRDWKGAIFIWRHFLHFFQLLFVKTLQRRRDGVGVRVREKGRHSCLQEVSGSSYPGWDLEWPFFSGNLVRVRHRVAGG